jgi:hypothetical protein
VSSLVQAIDTDGRGGGAGGAGFVRERAGAGAASSKFAGGSIAKLDVSSDAFAQPLALEAIDCGESPQPQPSGRTTTRDVELRVAVVKIAMSIRSSRATGSTPTSLATDSCEQQHALSHFSRVEQPQ